MLNPQSMPEHSSEPDRYEDSRIYVSESGLYALRYALPSASGSPGRAPAHAALQGRQQVRGRNRGLSFEEIRIYEAGDDVRRIDWRVSARKQSPHVRIYSEERNRPVLLIVDQRVGLFFGSELNLMSVTAAELTALCAWQALADGDHVGGIVFNDSGMNEIRPRGSEKNLLRLLHVLVECNRQLHAQTSPSSPPQASLAAPLSAAAQIARHDHQVIVISDFSGWNENLKARIKALAVHNDVRLFRISDPVLSELPQDLCLPVSDGRSSRMLNLANRETREAIAKPFAEISESLESLSANSGAELAQFSAAQPTEAQFQTTQQAIGRRRARGRV